MILKTVQDINGEMLGFNDDDDVENENGKEMEEVKLPVCM